MSTSSTPLPVPSVRGRFVRWFFANFFRLLIVAVSAAQWTVLWWLLAPPATSWLLHVLAIAAVYALNRSLTLRVRQPSLARHNIIRLPRTYYAVAFTCLFGALFLLINGALWGSVTLLAQLFAGEARGLDIGIFHPTAVGAASRWTGNLGLLVIGLVFTYGYTIGQRRLRTTTVPLPLRHAPAAWQGLRIAQISDIHIGPNLQREQLERFVGRVNETRADVICITGDIADNASADLETFLPILAGLRATHGVFAILGNHDHYAGAERITAELQRLTPFTVLRDAVSRVPIRGHELCIIGLDDRGRDWARGLEHVPQLDHLLHETSPAAPCLLLCHRPDVFPHAASSGIGLTLAGHTHGGQLALPGLGGRSANLARFITEFDRGLFERDGSFLYVNCGLGVTGQRIRLSTPREITVIEVQGSSPATNREPRPTTD